MLGALAVSPVRRNIVLLCLLSSGLSIAGLYIRELVRAPVRPQLLVLSGTYDAPWDINPWAGENLRQLERLQGRSVSIHRVNDLRTLAASSDAIVAALSEGKRSLRDAPLIVYVNLHGAVDEHGEPSLIPPGASADDSRTWISVRSLLQSLRSSAGSEHGILVAFESGRLAGAIRQLVQADRFAEGLQSLLAEEQFTGTSISAICAGGADRPSNNDWTGIGDPFTRILADALSGKADGFSPSNIQSTQSTILRDGFVDSHELSKYVVHELQHWNQRVYGCQVAISCFNTSPANTSTSLAGFAPNQIVAAPAEAVEGTEQRDSKVDALAETQSSQAPELDSFSDTSNCPNAFIAQAAPFRLTWCLSSIRPVEGVDPLPAPSAKAQIRSFWKELRDCSLEQPWTYFPGHWAQLQAEAVAYETSVYGGEAVRSEPRYAKNFQQHLKWLRRQLTDAKQLSVLKSRSGDAAKSWQQFSSSPTPEKARALSASWEGKLTAIPVLEILSRDTNNTTWEHSEELHRLAAKLQEVHLALTLASSLDGTKLKREALEEVNATSLAAFDHVLRGGHRVELNKLIDAFSLAADKFLALSSSVVASDRVIHIALEDAPAIASSLLLPSEVPCKLADHSLDQLSRLVESLREHLVAFSSPEKAIFGDRNETPRIRGAIEKLAETQHDMLHEYGRKNTSISLATQLLYLDRLLRFPTAVALASDGDAANIATLRLNARQRMIRNSQKLSMPVLRKEESTPIPASNSEAPTSITAAEPTGTAWGRSRTRKFWSDWGSLGRDASMQKPQSQPEVWQYAREDSRVIQGVETETRDDASSIPFAFGQLQSHAIRSRVVAGVLAEARGAWFVTRLRLSGEAADNLYAAGRAVDAFWAVPKIGGLAYFEAMANDLIERVQSCPTSRINQGPVNLNSTGNPSSAGNLNNIGESGGGVSAWQSLNQSLSSRRQITKDAVEIVTTWVPELAPSSSVLSLDTNSENQAIHWTPQVSMQSAEVNAQLPAGTGFLQFSGKPARCAVELPVSASDLHMQIDGDLVSENSALGSKLAQQSANLAFRGHLYGTPQHSSALELRASSVARKPASKTTLVVNDPFQATHDRTFILDCSSSMFAKAEGSFADPTPDSGLLSKSKLEAAKLALLRMLGTLVGSNDRVAVLLYGHRLADGTVEQGKLRQSKYHAKFPFSASLEAAEDVETILPLGRFGFAEYQAVEGRLKEVVPWGQTPLYLAVREAISQASATIEAHDIVVISDGRNYQFNPRPNMAPTLEQVLKSANAKGARLNLIGFGVPAQEQAAALADFKRLAEGTGGLAKLQVSEATELLDQLLSLVQQAPLQIQLPSGEKIVGNVNETIELANVNSLNSELTLSYQDRSSKIAVSRGDAIELNVNRAGLLSAAKYVAGQPKFANLLDARKRASNTLVGIHRPNAVGTAVEWTFSFQSTKAEIVSKPQHLVVQIEPLANGQTSSQQASAACYTYFDPLWQPGFTCPVTKIRTLNWPATASAAKINVWVQAKHRVAQRFSCSLKDLVSAQTANTNSASNKSISGYSIDVQNQGDSLQVLVRGLEEGKSIFDFVPRLSGWETPVKVRQEFIDSRGTSFLSFQFGSDLAAKHLEDIVISFDELEATKRNALGLQQPMIIELQPETDSLAAISQQLRR